MRGMKLTLWGSCNQNATNVTPSLPVNVKLLLVSRASLKTGGGRQLSTATNQAKQHRQSMISPVLARRSRGSSMLHAPAYAATTDVAAPGISSKSFRRKMLLQLSETESLSLRINS